jgi:hypothetical protein
MNYAISQGDEPAFDQRLTTSNGGNFRFIPSPQHVASDSDSSPRRGLPIKGPATIRQNRKTLPLAKKAKS